MRAAAYEGVHAAGSVAGFGVVSQTLAGGGCDGLHMDGGACMATGRTETAP